MRYAFSVIQESKFMFYYGIKKSYIHQPKSINKNEMNDEHISVLFDQVNQKSITHFLIFALVRVSPIFPKKKRKWELQRST
jgi:hypothetical protein